MKKRTIAYWLIGIMVVCIAILIGGSAFLLSYSLNPDKEAKENETISWIRENYSGTTEWMDSMTNVGALRDTFIINEKGVRLHAYYASCDSAMGTVILSHGYTDEARRMMMLGKLYHDSLRFNILIPDHERHGHSEGEEIQMGWHDRLNIERWIGVSDSLWHKAPTYLHGISMGAATVMMCSGDPLPPSVKGIIEDCGYTSVWDEFAGEIKNQFGLPVHPLMDIASWMCQIRYGWNFKEASALEQVRKSTLPMLFIHGDKDTFVPTAMVYQLYDTKIKGYKALWIAKGTEHALAYHDYPKEYLQQIRQFINNHE